MNNKANTKILALETCTSVCSVALWDGERLHEQMLESERSHSQQLLPMLARLLAEAGLNISAIDAIACTRGPGAFTGLRIGVGVAKGLAYGQDLPIYAVSSLAALAAGVIRAEPDARRICALLDARMGELYAAEFDVIDGYPCLLGSEQLTDIDALVVDNQCFAGTGALAYQAQLRAKQAHLSSVQFPTAADVIRLVRAGREKQQITATTAAALAPVYLRDKVVG